MLDYFVQLGPWNWLLLAAVLFILETVVPGVFLVWFGLAAAIAGGAAIAFDLGLAGQLTIFIVSSILTVLLARLFVNRTSRTAEAETLNVRAKQYIGHNFTLSDAIQNGRGRMKVGDTVWAVEGPELPLGTVVTVKGARGNVLLVEPVGNDTPSGLPHAGTFG
ncbi:MAG: NfeD family protein [Rhizobiales bacterium]|nr:NfeD family protein [Hyphomicrobiales bacterium]